MLKYISNTAHYKDVLSRVQSVKNMLWIGTADIKDLYIEVGKEKKPAQWKFSGDKHKSLQVYTERTFHQRYLLVML